MQDTFITLQTIAADTPTWVYILFIFLVYMGIKARRPQVMPFAKVFILPLVFVFMSWHMLERIAMQNFLQFILGMLALIVGVGLGWWYITQFTIKVDKKHRLIEMPGTWSILIIVLFVFISNYYFQVVMHAQPLIAKQSWFIICMLVILGTAKGYFVGRALALWRCFERPKIVADLSIDRDFK